MMPYRFSPIRDGSELIAAITYIHIACHRLCRKTLDRYLPAAGNIGVFCHFEDEYARLTNMRENITNPTEHVYGKYFRLHEPIIIPATGEIPKTRYTHLYIRAPDPRKPHVGDVDFYLEPEKYTELKQSLRDGKPIIGARILDRPDLNLVELYDPDTDVLGYIGDKQWS